MSNSSGTQKEPGLEGVLVNSQLNLLGTRQFPFFSCSELHTMFTHWEDSSSDLTTTMGHDGTTQDLVPPMVDRPKATLSHGMISQELMHFQSQFSSANSSPLVGGDFMHFFIGDFGWARNGQHPTFQGLLHSP